MQKEDFNYTCKFIEKKLRKKRFFKYIQNKFFKEIFKKFWDYYTFYGGEVI